MPFRVWAELNTSDFTALPQDAVALLPVGAIEQHGPHLPLSTDTTLAEGLALEAAKRVDHATILVLPSVAIGKSDEHLSFKGTLTLDAETLLAVLLQIGRGVARAGVRRLVFLNAHGGNVPVLQIAARTLRVELGMFCLAAGWMSMGYPEGVVSADEAADGIHGGFVETAAMLHFRPDLVAIEKAKRFVPASRAVAENNRVLRLLGPVSSGWMIEDLHPEGAAGDAASATADAGRRIVEHAAGRYATLLEEVSRHPVDGLRGAS